MSIRESLGRFTLTAITIGALAFSYIPHHPPKSQQRGCSDKDIQFLIKCTEGLTKYIYEKPEPEAQPHYSFNNEATMIRPR